MAGQLFIMGWLKISGDVAREYHTILQQYSEAIKVQRSQKSGKKPVEYEEAAVQGCALGGSAVAYLVAPTTSILACHSVVCLVVEVFAL